MQFKNIEIVSVEEAPPIKELKEGFSRMIFHYSDRPSKEWLDFFSEEYDKVRLKDMKIETIDGHIIVQCRLDDLQKILDGFKIAALMANTRYEEFLLKKQKKQEESKKIYNEKRKKVEEAINKLNFD